MDFSTTAREVASALGGSANVVASDVQMTRLRISLEDASLADLDRLANIQSVLGVSQRSEHSFDIVFIPSVVDGVYNDFAKLTGTVSIHPVEVPKKSKGASSSLMPRMGIHVSPGERRSFAAQAEALARIVDEMEGSEPDRMPDQQGDPEGPRLLVINGPNINMLGIREPDVYGKEDFASLLALCRRSALEAGFSKCRCFQSNHEGEMVDENQRAYDHYDGIVMNPGAYTHTSIALLDALKSVAIPCIEVHISKVEEREDFRQVSYVRVACFGTISGMGLRGSRKAIFEMAEPLKSAS
ncbi:MAG: type II 3-dehydroquinate dehydratase, partial [Atopobiaceae bacterium]|nr:type II 3-dehydroquinate dehydratase [Atopobiaceae bacterium]